MNPFENLPLDFLWGNQCICKINKRRELVVMSKNGYTLPSFVVLNFPAKIFLTIRSFDGVFGGVNKFWEKVIKLRVMHIIRK